MRGTLIVCAELGGLFEVAAERVASALAAAGEKQKIVSFALAGGNTPRALYQRLAREEISRRIPWSKVHIFWGDERIVPHKHPESNFRLANETFLQKVPLPPENIHAVPTNLVAEEAAESYEQTLRKHFRLWRGFPKFDLILLGLGADGHVASLFPWTAPLEEKNKMVATAHSLAGSARVSLTLPVINSARRVYFLTTGQDKSSALQKAMEESGDLPVQRVAPAKGELVWLVDQSAASGLTQMKVHA